MNDACASIETLSAGATRALGRSLAGVVREGDVIVLTGDLGAGKTVIAKGLAEGLDIAEPVTSPTFNILLVHQGTMTLAHFDLFRLDKTAQLEDIDFWGTIESGVVSVIEWGDRFPEALPPDVLTARLTITGDESRRIDLFASGRRATELAEAWSDAASGFVGVAGEGKRGRR